MVSNNNNTNTYTIVDFPENNQCYGKFKGTIPKKVASKAFSSLVQFMDIDLEKEEFQGIFIVFVIKKTKTGKMYKYIGNRVKLHNPIKISKNGVEVEYKYKNVIGKYRNELDKI
jgi:hypothetical protein